MKIAILGGAGFLGYRLLELLNDSTDQVSLYDNRNSTILEPHFNNKGKLRLKLCNNQIIH